jgi:hypothetical protein
MGHRVRRVDRAHCAPLAFWFGGSWVAGSSSTSLAGDALRDRRPRCAHRPHPRARRGPLSRQPRHASSPGSCGTISGPAPGGRPQVLRVYSGHCRPPWIKRPMPAEPGARVRVRDLRQSRGSRRDCAACASRSISERQGGQGGGGKASDRLIRPAPWDAIVEAGTRAAHQPGCNAADREGLRHARGDRTAAVPPMLHPRCRRRTLPKASWRSALTSWTIASPERALAWIPGRVSPARARGSVQTVPRGSHACRRFRDARESPFIHADS